MRKKEEFKNEPIVRDERVAETECYEVFILFKADNVVRIAIDKYIMSKLTFTTFEEAKAYIDSKPYELIINAACCLMELSTKNH